MRFLSFYAYPHPLEIKIKEWIIACVYQIRCGNEHNHDHINNRQNMGTGRHLSGELLCQIFTRLVHPMMAITKSNPKFIRKYTVCSSANVLPKLNIRFIYENAVGRSFVSKRTQPSITSSIAYMCLINPGILSRMYSLFFFSGVLSQASQ